MTRYDFQGQIFEKGHRVLTDTVEEVVITPTDGTPQGEIVVTDTDDGHKALQLNLTLPKGDTGPMPRITAQATTLAADEQATADIDPDPTDPEHVTLSLGIPRGESIQGEKGDMREIGKIQMLPVGATPIVDYEMMDGVEKAVLKLPYSDPIYIDVNSEVDTETSTAYVKDETEESTDVITLKFGIPKGQRGEKGDTGEAFYISPEQIYISETKMLEALETEGAIETNSFCMIAADVDDETNAKVYYFTDEDRILRPEDYEGQYGNLIYINDFSGAKGANSKVFLGSYQEVTQDQPLEITMDLNDPTYMGDPDHPVTKHGTQYATEDTWGTWFNFKIPVTAPYNIASVTASRTNKSTDNPSATVSTAVYNSSTNKNEQSLSLVMPKAADAKIIGDNVDVITGQPGTDADITITTPTYNQETDTWDTEIVSMTIPAGAIPHLGVGTVIPADDPEDAAASITYNDPQDYSEAVINLTLPRGLKGDKGDQGIDGQLVDINSINQETYNSVTDISINDENPGILDVTYGGISTNDIISGTLGTERGGLGNTSGLAAAATKLDTARAIGVNLSNAGDGTTVNFDGTNDISISPSGVLPVANGGSGSNSLTSNAVLLGNGANAIKTKQTASGAFYATAADAEPSFGTLPVSQGGTGKTTNTSNSVLLGNGSSAIKNKATASGAFYATAANAEPVFGTLPIAQGGTGLTSSPSMLTNLGSTTAANVLAASPRPGVTGTLAIGHGGTGATTAANARSNLGAVTANLDGETLILTASGS